MANPIPSGPAGASGRPITPAPPVRPRPPRPEKRPEIKLSAPKEESRFIGPVPLAIGMIALAATLGFAHRMGTKTEDPNYLRAKDSLFQYESGLTETELNYDSPIYAEALDALAKVDPHSISSEKATILAADIQSKTELFHRRAKARTDAELAIQNGRVDREQENLAARERSLATVRTVFDECKEEKDGHGHAH